MSDLLTVAVSVVAAAPFALMAVVWKARRRRVPDLPADRPPPQRCLSHTRTLNTHGAHR